MRFWWFFFSSTFREWLKMSSKPKSEASVCTGSKETNGRIKLTEWESILGIYRYTNSWLQIHKFLNNFLNLLLPSLAWLADTLLMAFEGSALEVLGGLIPELTELAALFVLWGGMGTGPLRATGVNGSIAFGFTSLVWTEKIKRAVSEICTF